MNPRRCCQSVTHGHDDVRRPASRWRRGGELTGWIIPSVTLVLLPKCPVCVAMYIALFSGVGISLANASILRSALLILCVATLLCLALHRLRRVVGPHKAMAVARTQFPHNDKEP